MFVLSLDVQTRQNPTRSPSTWFGVNQVVLKWCFLASHIPKMAKCELIELQDLTPDDRIELAPPSDPPPTLERWGKEKVVRMVGERVRLEDPDWLTCKPGRGHDFQPCSQTQLSWCDLCGEFIWGLYRQSLRCTRESFTQIIQNISTGIFVFCCVNVSVKTIWPSVTESK